MRMLVTGGAGFIGSHIVDELVACGHEVRVVDSLSPAAHRTRPGYLDPNVDYRFEDLATPGVAAAAVAGVDAVCHQASRVGLGVDFGDVAAYVADNDAATAALLAALHERRYAGRLVLASSMVVYGEGGYRCPEHGRQRPGPRRELDLRSGRFEPTCSRCRHDLEPIDIDEDEPLDPRNVYAATKVHQEQLCTAYARVSGAEVVRLRYHNVYGPRMPRDTPYAGVASIFRSAVQAGAAPRVFEDGGQRRDFVHVEDVAHANVLALTATGPVEGAVNIASGRPHTLWDMATALHDAAGSTAAPVVTGDYRLGDVRHITASPRRAREMLGFVARVGLNEGMARFAVDPMRA
ncbi:MAG: NAD-dependent epimerase/dehydratase family protein [Dermatophilaceae bacterium]